MKAVVVGVSPATGSPTALRWGWEEARLRDVPLRAVLAWRPPRPPAAPAGRPPVTSYAGDDPEKQANETLRAFVQSALNTTEGIECVAAHGSPVQVLVTASKDAHLVVIGEPRHGRLASVRSGLVAPQLVMRSWCPVMVMPAAVHVAI
jgi:nucleotide-binding universal stress UspA family protein